MLMSATALRVRVWIRPRLVVLTALLISVIAGRRRSRRWNPQNSDTRQVPSLAGSDPDLLSSAAGGEPLTGQVALPGVAGSSKAFATSFLVSPEWIAGTRAHPFTGENRFLGARLVAGRFADPAASEFTANRTLLRTSPITSVRRSVTIQVTSFDPERWRAMSLRLRRATRSAAVHSDLVGVTEMPSDFDVPRRPWSSPSRS